MLALRESRENLPYYELGGGESKPSRIGVLTGGASQIAGVAQKASGPALAFIGAAGTAATAWMLNMLPLNEAHQLYTVIGLDASCFCLGLGVQKMLGVYRRVSQVATCENSSSQYSPPTLPTQLATAQGSPLERRVSDQSWEEMPDPVKAAIHHIQKEKELSSVVGDWGKTSAQQFQNREISWDDIPDTFEDLKNVLKKFFQERKEAGLKTCIKDVIHYVQYNQPVIVHVVIAVCYASFPLFSGAAACSTLGMYSYVVYTQAVDQLSKLTSFGLKTKKALNISDLAQLPKSTCQKIQSIIKKYKWSVPYGIVGGVGTCFSYPIASPIKSFVPIDIQPLMLMLSIYYALRPVGTLCNATVKESLQTMIEKKYPKKAIRTMKVVSCLMDKQAFSKAIGFLLYTQGHTFWSIVSGVAIVGLAVGTDDYTHANREIENPPQTVSHIPFKQRSYLGKTVHVLKNYWGSIAITGFSLAFIDNSGGYYGSVVGFSALIGYYARKWSVLRPPLKAFIDSCQLSGFTVGPLCTLNGYPFVGLPILAMVTGVTQHQIDEGGKAMHGGEFTDTPKL